MKVIFPGPDQGGNGGRVDQEDQIDLAQGASKGPVHNKLGHRSL